MERMAGGGREAFNRGETAGGMEAFLRAHGGFLAASDLAEHKSEWVERVSANYRGYDVWELPPNTQGIAALQMWNILEGFDRKPKPEAKSRRAPIRHPPAGELDRARLPGAVAYFSLVTTVGNGFAREPALTTPPCMTARNFAR